MYERFFGFRERPFELTPDPRYLFLGAAHREALSNLTYGMSARKGLTVLVGEVGSGKTTLVRRALAAASEQKTHCVFLKDPQVTPDEFTRFLCKELGLPDLESAPRWQWSQALERHLALRAVTGDMVALVIDEAQSLSDEMFEELRLLSNMETDTAKLLPLVLVGQPELGDRLSQPGLRHLKQRIALRCSLRALDLHEAAAYIAARITVAGGQSASVFTREAVTGIHRASQGLPRAISVLCDNALITAFAAGQKPVNSAIVAEVCKDFDYLQPAVAEPPSDAPDDPVVADVVKEPEPPAIEDRAADDRSELFGNFRERRRFSIFGGASGR